MAMKSLGGGETRITVDGLDQAVKDILDSYGEDVKDALEETKKEVADEALKIVKENVPVDKGVYKKGLKIKSESELGSTNYTILNQGKEKSLSHLLEFGHAKAKGTGRAKGKKHFTEGQNYIKENFEEKFRSKVEKG